VKDAQKDKILNIFWNIKNVRKKKWLAASIFILTGLLNRYLFLLFFEWAIFFLYDGLVKNLDLFPPKKKAATILALSAFALEINAIVLGSQNMPPLHWTVIFIFLGKYLLTLSESIFKKGSFLSLNCLVVYALVNSFLMTLTLKVGDFKMLSLMNVLIFVAIFFQGEFWNKCRAKMQTGGGLSNFFLDIFCFSAAPAHIMFVFYLFNWTRF
jgi:hypothetical protein